MTLSRKCSGLIAGFVLFVLFSVVIPVQGQDALSFTATGIVSSGTPGVSLPAGMPITLHVVRTDPATNAPMDIQTYDGTLDASNRYRFENISAFVGDSVFVTMEYEGVRQGSLITQLNEGQTNVELPVILYAPSSDPSNVTLINAQYILDFKAGNVLQILATFYYRNNSDRFFLSTEKTSDGKPVSVTIPLPVGASAIAFSPLYAGRLAIGGTDILPVVQDTRAVIPGQVHEVVFSFQVPYEGGAPIDQDYPFFTDSIEVFIPDDAQVRLTGDFTSAQNKALNPQRPYTQYILKTPVKAGERLIYTLESTNLPTQRPPVSRVSTGDISGIVLVIVVALGLMTLGTVFTWWVRRNQAE